MYEAGRMYEATDLIGHELLVASEGKTARCGVPHFAAAASVPVHSNSTYYSHSSEIM